MADASAFSPDEVPATGDPGDDTARRYRYQWTYAAIACCMLLDDTLDVIEVFCEHHEDVLLKHADSTFTGVQVKTRSLGQEMWKTSDAAVRRSCARFARLYRSLRRLELMPQAINEFEEQAGALQGRIDRLRTVINEERDRLRAADANIAAIAAEFKRVMLAVSFPGVSEEDEVVINPRKSGSNHFTPRSTGSPATKMGADCNSC